MNTTCQHAETHQISPDYCYTGSVAVHPYTDENRAAHGGISYMEECAACGARRAVNQNQRHVEYSPFGPTLAEREEQARREDRARRAAEEAADRAAVESRGVRVLRVFRPKESERHEALLEIRGQGRNWVRLSEIRAAAEQPDTGDGLVPFYRGLRRIINECRA